MRGGLSERLVKLREHRGRKTRTGNVHQFPINSEAALVKVLRQMAQLLMLMQQVFERYLFLGFAERLSQQNQRLTVQVVVGQTGDFF